MIFFKSPSRLHYVIHIRINEDVVKYLVENFIAFRMQNTILQVDVPQKPQKKHIIIFRLKKMSKINKKQMS